MFPEIPVGSSRDNILPPERGRRVKAPCMKQQLESPRELNPPPEMLARATAALALAAFSGGILLTLIGVMAAQPRLSLLGLLVLALGWLVRGWLQRREAKSCNRAMAQVWREAPALDERRVAELLSLLQRWEAEEEKRGTPEFDPWALQSLRNEIRQVVESDPGLEELFDRLRQVA